jgi:anti-anti-sigma factor
MRVDKGLDSCGGRTVDAARKPSHGGNEKGGPVMESVEFADPLRSLAVELESADRSCRLVLRGTLCDTSIAALEAQFDQLGCLPCDEVIVDMQHLTSLDPIGANVLVGLYHYVIGRGGQLRVISARGNVSAVLHATAGDLIPISAAS